MSEKDKILKEIKQYIENIEQLGADTRYDFDYEYYDKINVDFDSISWWCKKGMRSIKKLKEIDFLQKDTKIN